MGSIPVLYVMSVEFVGSLLCFEGFSTGPLVFLPPQNQLLKSNSILGFHLDWSLALLWLTRAVMVQPKASRFFLSHVQTIFAEAMCPEVTQVKLRWQRNESLDCLPARWPEFDFRTRHHVSRVVVLFLACAVPWTFFQMWWRVLSFFKDSMVSILQKSTYKFQFPLASP